MSSLRTDSPLEQPLWTPRKRSGAKEEDGFYWSQKRRNVRIGCYAGYQPVCMFFNQPHSFQIITINSLWYHKKVNHNKSYLSSMMKQDEEVEAFSLNISRWKSH